MNTLPNEVKNLIENSKGKFFSLTFEKKDGSIRTVNAKDFYKRLIKGNGEQSAQTAGLKNAGYKSAVNRNLESWFSFKPEKVVAFKCGKTDWKANA